jgi:hypothetical protein
MKYVRIDYWKYKVVEPLWVATGIKAATWAEIKSGDTLLAVMDTLGLLRIYPGYSWDGASGPAIDTPNFMTASLVHDVLCQFIRLGKLPVSARKAADQALYDLCIAAGMNWFRAQYVYQAVRLFGEANAKGPMPQDLNKIYEAK